MSSISGDIFFLEVTTGGFNFHVSSQKKGREQKREPILDVATLYWLLAASEQVPWRTSSNERSSG